MSMPALPGSLRGETPVQGFVIVGVAALASAALSAYIADARPSSLGEIAIGILPFIVLVITLVTAVSMRFLRERLRSAIDLGIEAALIGLLVGALVTATGWITDGTSESAIAAPDAISFFLTGGIFPLSSGPSAAVRFFPLVAAIVVAIRARRRGSIPHAAGAILLVYALLHVALLSPTVVGIMSAARHGTLASDDVSLFKTLTSAHADGYWTSSQAERFFLPVARQTENALLAFRASVALILAGVVCVGVFATSSVTASLLKRLVSMESIRIWLIAICGLTLGLASAASSASHTIAFALILSTFVLSAWITAFRFRMDLVELPRHEREHPDYPLPSGAIQSQELEIVIVSLLSFSLVGAFVLGYPVFVALLAATVCARLSEESVPTFPRWVTLFLSAALFLALAEAGGLMGSKLSAVPGWTGRIFLALALLQVLRAVFQRYALDLESRILGVVMSVVAFGGIAWISNQWIFWIATGLAAGILAFASRSPGKWHRLTPWAFDGALILVALLSLIVPQFFRRF